MSRLGQFRLALTVALTTGLIALAYEAKDQFSPYQLQGKIVGVVLSLTLGPSTAAILARLAFSINFVRRFVLGPSWIEGVWLIETYVGAKMVTCGVSQSFYRGKTDSLEVHIWFPVGIDGSGPAFSTSTSVLLRESDLLYMNYFISSGPESDSVGVAVGHFFSDEGSRISSRYEGKVLYVGQSPLVRQIGYRLSPQEVADARSAGGIRGWMSNLISSRFPNMFDSEVVREKMVNPSSS